MSLAARFRELISGQTKGPIAAVSRVALSALELLYAAVVRRRNLRFDRSVVCPERVHAPVISVGNLTVGGTGKTPMVAWLAGWFLDRQSEVTIISRGYGARKGRQNDEALELAARLPGVPHLQNPDRIAAARAALSTNVHQILILDDAFQHRRIARDLDIVLLDALEPLGYEHLLPRGLLREPPASLSRAHVVALSRSDAVSEVRRREIAARVQSLAPGALWIELIHEPVGFASASGTTLNHTALRGQRVAAFCGIGNPGGFRHTLDQLALNVVSFLELSDHSPYGEREIDRLTAWLASLDVDQVVCTRKDLVKIQRNELAGKPLLALEIELRILRGQAELEELLETVRMSYQL